MIQFRRIVAVVLMSAAAAGCAGIKPSADAPRLTAADVPSPPPPLYPATVMPGDVIDVRFFPNTMLRSGTYRIQAGDLLRMDVADQPDLSRDLINVLPDGSIALPLIGRVVVAGKTPEQVSQEVSRAYSRRGLQNPVAVISVTQDQRRVRLLYEALTRQTGGNSIQYRVQEGQSIDLPFIPAISPNQPFDAIRRQIRDAYTREFDGQIEVTANLTQRDPQAYYVMGEVQRPGGFPLTPGTTPLTAVATAGGFLNTAEPTNTLLVRFDPSGGYQYWVVNMKQALGTPGDAAGRFPLQRNDVIFVAKSDIAEFNLFIEQYIRRALPADIGFGFSYEVSPNNN